MLTRVLAALALSAVSAYAQGGTVSGVVYDSTAHAPLDGATVQIAKGEFVNSATSDATGRFILSDLAPGTYTLGFFHPVLDSIGVEAPTREVTVPDSRGVIVDLAVPSPARIRTAICGPPRTADSTAVIIGTVRDAITEQPASGVSVTGEWLEYVINRGGMNRQLARLSAKTGENGWFAICNVPGSGIVALTASRGNDSTGVIEVQVPPERFLRREIYLGSVETEAAPAPATANPAPNATTVSRVIHVGNGRITGKIVAVEGNRPLANALVIVVDGPFTRTNDQGEFTLTRAPGGTQMIEVRAVGYYPSRRQVNIVTNAPPVNMSLSTLKAVLDTVKIVAKRLPQGPDDGGFQRRRRQSFGKFMTPQDVIKWSPVETTDLFRHFSGVRTTLNEFGQPMLQMRGAFAEYCEPAIFINGANMSFMDTADINTWVKPSEIAGLEVYTGTMVPGEFQEGLRGCGSIVIWTK